MADQYQIVGHVPKYEKKNAFVDLDSPSFPPAQKELLINGEKLLEKTLNELTSPEVCQKAAVAAAIRNRLFPGQFVFNYKAVYTNQEKLEVLLLEDETLGMSCSMPQKIFIVPVRLNGEIRDMKFMLTNENVGLFDQQVFADVAFTQE